jgi:flavin reductase (DIM6/NTAB) family NADH-FMN oxidoreductase RutF
MSMKMQGFDPDRLQPAENYKLLAGSVVPRPIAFVSTVDQAGLRNVAPYSFFTVASANPPVVCFCPAVRPASNGLAAHKDTLANVRATGEFVVNIVSMDFVEKMNAAAAQVAPGVDEFALAGLTPAPSEVVRAPGVSESRVRMECRLLQVVEVSELVMGGSIVLGRVVRFHVAEEVLRERMHIDPQSLDAVGRMAGSTYIRTLDRFDLERPG